MVPVTATMAAGRPNPMTIPLTIRCECGETSPVELGDRVICRCGRRYDTSHIPRDEYLRVQATQVRLRLWARMGLVLVLAAAVLAWAFYGPIGAAFAAPAVAGLWFRVIQPRLRRQQEAELADLPSWTLEASE